MLKVLAVQRGWLAVDKPYGMSVHNQPGEDLVSLLSGLIEADQSLAEKLGIGSSIEIHPVHRLDKETSGVILLSTGHQALAMLGDLFMNHRVQKRYIALVHGTFDEESKGARYWEMPLTKTAGGRTDPAGKGRKVPCQTRYNVLQQSHRYALLEIDLMTGRKHQIRRHAKLSGHPVTGDTRYGSKKSVQYLKQVLGYDRMGLHCKRLAFEIPGQKDKVVIESFNPLSEMMQLLSQDQ